MGVLVRLLASLLGTSPRPCVLPTQHMFGRSSYSWCILLPTQLLYRTYVDGLNRHEEGTGLRNERSTRRCNISLRHQLLPQLLSRRREEGRERLLPVPSGGGRRRRRQRRQATAAAARRRRRLATEAPARRRQRCRRRSARSCAGDHFLMYYYISTVFQRG